MKQREQNKLSEMEQFLAHQFVCRHDMRGRVYICSPLSAKSETESVENMYRARAYMYYADKEMGKLARAPHAYLPMLLCDRVPDERALALQFGLRLLEESDILMVCGDRISMGMKGEILHAISIKIRILTFSKPMYKKVCEYVKKENGDMEMVDLDENHPFMAGEGQIQILEKPISENEYTDLLDARDRLCNFCQSQECEKCQVTKLADDAHFEAEKAGILSDS